MNSELDDAGRRRVVQLGLCAHLELDVGEWDRAADLAQAAAREATRESAVALAVLGLVRARRGEPGAWQALDGALAVAPGTGTPAHTFVSGARAEAAWLEGRSAAVLDETHGALTAVASCSDQVEMLGELLCWRRRAGACDTVPADLSAAHTAQLAGDWAEAARLWTERARPYEAALALADARDTDALRRSVAALRALGADPAAQHVARRLRERGVRTVVRGSRQAGRSSTARLTDRELEVLDMVSRGMRNAAVADRLYLSPRTVDHHVASIMRKLDGRTRGEAVAAAARLGLLRRAEQPGC